MKGWRRSIVINAIGAVTTFVVLIVVAASKWSSGAWLSILIMALLVPVFYSIHHHYMNVKHQLDAGRVRAGAPGSNHVVLLVRDFDVATAEAVGYLRSFRPEDIRAVFPSRGDAVASEVQARWRTFVGPGIPDLAPIPASNLTSGIRTLIGGIERGADDFVTVVVPELLRSRRLFSYLLHSRDLVRLKASLLRTRNVVVTDVPVVLEEGTPSGAGGKPLIPQRTVTLVFLSSVNDVSVRAVNYARTLDATVTRAVYFDLDPEAALVVGDHWFDVVEGVPLDIVEAPFRDLSHPDARGGAPLHRARRHGRERRGAGVRGGEVVAAAAARPDCAVRQAPVPVRGTRAAHERRLPARDLTRGGPWRARERAHAATRLRYGGRRRP